MPVPTDYPRCRTCRFFLAKDDERLRGDSYSSGAEGVCVAVRGPSGRAPVNDPTLMDEIDRLARADLARAQDASDYFAALHVSRDFGCVMHQDRPA